MQTRYIVTLLILYAGLALPSDQVGAAKKSAVKPAKSGLAAPVKPLAGNAYEAVLARPVPFKKVYKAAGLSWTCFNSTCAAHGAAVRPSPAQCRGLEKQVGKLKSCGRKSGPSAVLAPGLIRKTPDAADKAPTAKLAPGMIRKTPDAAGKSSGMVRKPGPAESKKPGSASSKKPSSQVDPGSMRRPGRTPRSGSVRAPDVPDRPGFIRTAPIVVTGAPDIPPPPDRHAIVGPDLTIRTEPITVTGSP